MPMMNVRKMRMRMRDWRVLMRVHVWFHAVPLKLMRVLMMFVVPVRMVVSKRYVGVRMFVSFSNV